MANEELKIGDYVMVHGKKHVIAPSFVGTEENCYIRKREDEGLPVISLQAAIGLGGTLYQPEEKDNGL